MLNYPKLFFWPCCFFLEITTFQCDGHGSIFFLFWFLSLFLFLILFMYMGVLGMYVCTPCLWLGSDPLRTQVKMTLSYHMDAENQTQVIWRSIKYSELLNHISSFILSILHCVCMSVWCMCVHMYVHTCYATQMKFSAHLCEVNFLFPLSNNSFYFLRI